MSADGKMNPEIRTQWVAALRSGEYEQGKSFLKRDDTYCCLGVLCDLAVKAGVELEVGVDNGVTFYNWSSSGLVDQVLEWSGVKDALGYLPMPLEGYHYLAYANDHGLSFDQIANAIEEQL